MSKGFSRLKSVSVAGAMGMGMLGGLAGSARAATLTLPAAFTFSRGSTAAYYGSTNATPSPTAGNTSAVGNITWAIDPGYTGSPGAWTSQTAFAIADANLRVSVDGTNTTTYADQYDTAFQVTVDGTAFVNPDGNVDLSGNVLTSDTATVNGLDTTVQMAFGNAYAGSAAVLYSFTNNTGGSRDAAVSMGGNLGSDGNTNAQHTSDGDGTIEMTDYWYTSSDTADGIDPVPGDDPVFTLCRYGAGGAVIPVPVSMPGTSDGMARLDNFVERYQITVPAGETRSILVFAFMSDSLAGGASAGQFCESASAAYSAGLVEGLDEENLANTLNYDFSGLVSGGVGGGDDGATPDYGPNTAASALGGGTGGDNLGAWSWSLTGLLGLLGLARRRRIKR